MVSKNSLGRHFLQVKKFRKYKAKDLKVRVFILSIGLRSVILKSIFLETPLPRSALFSLPPQRNFPTSFKPKVATAKFLWKIQKKSGTYYEKWFGRHASFPPGRSVKKFLAHVARVKKNASSQQSVVSIYGPLGYGPSTLPLRHSACCH